MRFLYRILQLDNEVFLSLICASIRVGLKSQLPESPRPYIYASMDTVLRSRSQAELPHTHSVLLGQKQLRSLGFGQREGPNTESRGLSRTVFSYFLLTWGWKRPTFTADCTRFKRNEAVRGVLWTIRIYSLYLYQRGILDFEFCDLCRASIRAELCYVMIPIIWVVLELLTQHVL